MLRKLKRLDIASIKLILLSVLSGILLSLPFTLGFLWIFSWFGFLPLFAALRNTNNIKAFFLSYLCGIVFWAATIYWLIHVTLLGTILLILYLALYFAAFGALVSKIRYPPPLLSFILIPSLWVALEYVRTYLFTGFPWALLGYAQYLNLPVIQIADITGAYGVSFLIVMMNASLADLAHHKKKKITKNIFLLSCLMLIALNYGYYKLYKKQDFKHLRLSVIQPNIPQELKWDLSARSFIFNRYANITQSSAISKPDLIIWPEAASPVLLGEDDAYFAEIFSLARDFKTNLLIGTVRVEKEEYYNSAILIGERGEVISRYDKLHRVPFGEYIPLKNIFPFLETIVPIGDISRGDEEKVFTLRDNKFSVLICFEDVFPDLSRRFVKQGAQLLVNITNDAWYKDTSAPFQHLQASVFRAIENRVSLARSANTGISAIIDSTGRIKGKVKNSKGKETFVSGFLTLDVPISTPRNSFYTHFGDLFAVLCFLIALHGIIYTFRKRL